MRLPHLFYYRYFCLSSLVLILILFADLCFGYGNLQFKDDQGNTVNSLWDERSYNSDTFPDGIPWLLNDWDPCSVIDINLSEFELIPALPGTF